MLYRCIDLILMYVWGEHIYSVFDKKLETFVL